MRHGNAAMRSRSVGGDDDSYRGRDSSPDALHSSNWLDETLRHRGLTRTSAVSALVLGFLTFYIISASGVASWHSSIGSTARVQKHCVWVKHLVEAESELKWFRGMEGQCGKTGEVVEYHKRKSGDIVLLRHNEREKYYWPVGATSLGPVKIPSEFQVRQIAEAEKDLRNVEKQYAGQQRSKVESLLKRLGHPELFAKFREEGLDKFDLLADATEEDRRAVGVEASLWSTIVQQAKLASKRSGLPAANPGAAVPERPIASLDTIHFIHVPKAGGTAFTAPLRQIVGCTAVACLGWPKDHAPCPKLEGCFDHHPLSKEVVASKKAGEISLLVVNLRHPVDRVVSAFHHGRREWPCCGLPQYKEFKERLFNGSLGDNPFTISTFAEHLGTRNCMTKMLVGIECKAFKVEVDEQMANRAVENLQLFDVVLVQEYVSESIDLLACISGKRIDKSQFQKKVRAGGYNNKGTDEERAAVEQFNKWDMLIHAKSHERFCTLHKQHRCQFTPPPFCQ